MTLSKPPANLLEGASLFLDLDGTLIDFADHPSDIDVDEVLRNDLLALDAALQGRLAIISGRSIDDLNAHLRVPGLSLAGSHGLEFQRAGKPPMRPERPRSLNRAVAELRKYAEPRGLVVETKPAGAALHFRNDPTASEEAIGFVKGLARECQFEFQLGTMVAELRPFGSNKGSIVRQFMKEPPFDAGRPVAVGDDLTDEDAFEAAIALGGHAVLVGAERRTAADYRLPSVDDARKWLRQGI
jgi:trehalose 6-phosphate phosphatase